MAKKSEPRAAKAAAAETPNTTSEGTPLDGKVPSGKIQDIWDSHRFNMKLVNPSNRRNPG